jgi:hypothetical protein
MATTTAPPRTQAEYAPEIPARNLPPVPYRDLPNALVALILWALLVAAAAPAGLLG